MLSPFGKIARFQITASLNGQPLDLLKITESVRRAAQIRFKFDFDGIHLSTTGQMRLDFFKPGANAQAEDKTFYRTFLESDNGEGFVTQLLSDPKLLKWSLKRAKAPWLLEFRFATNLVDVAPEVDDKRRPVSPGPFKGEVDSVDAEFDSINGQGVFANATDLKRYVQSLAGIRVYRDGFGIRVDEDWLNLRSAWTSGRSWYSLRPDNTIGYVSLSARENAGLEEKTDREGFRRTPEYQNFYRLLSSFVGSSGKLLNDLGRRKAAYIKAGRKERAQVPTSLSPEELASELASELAAAGGFERSLVKATAAVSGVVEDTRVRLGASRLDQHELSEALDSVETKITEALAAVIGVRSYLGRIGESAERMRLLRVEIVDLRQQLEQLYEMVGLGLTAEALSHEILQVTDQLAHRTSRIATLSRSRVQPDAQLLEFTAYVETSLSALRKQMAHLAPSLRYVRERRETIDLSSYLSTLAEYHNERLGHSGIAVQVTWRSKPFAVNVNQGKLTQIFDNLVLNSEYWLTEDARLGGSPDAAILIEGDRPVICYSDSGPGIDPAVEASLFDPFVTMKGRGGRGLGLFIVKQFMEAEGCTISLDSDRNSRGRLFRFRLDLSGMLSVDD